ncbi:hypothetical protein GW17_00052075, partial [Ensete ventricosum]
MRWSETLREVKFRSVFRAPSRIFKILAILNVWLHGKSYEHGFTRKYDDHKHCAKSRVSVDFRASSRKFNILVIPNVLAHGKSYEHGFTKKCNGHKLSAKSRKKSIFDQIFMHRLRNSKYWTFAIRRSSTLRNVAREVEFRSVFRATSQKFKILVIPNVLVHGKLYKHGFTKKYDVHKFYAMSRVKSSFDRFSCTVSEIQNIGHSQFKFRSVYRALSQKFKILAIPNVLAHWKSYEHDFMTEYDVHKLWALLRAKLSFDRFFMHCLKNLKYQPLPALAHGKSYE